MQLCFPAALGFPSSPSPPRSSPTRRPGGPGLSLPGGSRGLGCVTVLTLCLLCSSLPPPSRCPSDFRTVVGTAATARKSPPGCRAQPVLQPLGPPCLSGRPAEREASPKDEAAVAPRGGFVYSFTSLAEGSEDGSSAGSSTRRLPQAREPPATGEPTSPGQTWTVLSILLGMVPLPPAGCCSPPGPRAGERDRAGVGQGRAGAALLPHSVVSKRRRRFGVYLYPSVCT